MWFKHPAWIPTAWVLAVINVVAVWVAAVPAEPAHATLHGALAALFVLGAERLRARARTLADRERLQELETRFTEFSEGEGMETRLRELEERLDFTERALVEARSRTPLPRGE
jgi:hypothetical protein